MSFFAVFADDGESDDDAYGADSKLLNSSPQPSQLRTKKISTGSNQSVRRISQTSLLASVQKATFLKNFERKHLLSADDARYFPLEYYENKDSRDLPR